MPVPQPRLFGAIGTRAYRGYVIHLADRKDRNGNVYQLLENANRAGISMEVLGAVDCRSCSDLEVLPFVDYSFKKDYRRSHLRGGEQGCLASFLAAFRAAWKNGGERGTFFLEDDAVVPESSLRAMTKILDQNANVPILLHGRRSYPGGWGDKLAEMLKEDKTEGAFAAGWHTIIDSPNYSNACFALSRAGVQALLPWIARLIFKGMHKIPADDLLSVACGAHNLSSHPVTSNLWKDIPPILYGIAPQKELMDRLITTSDTERRRAPSAASECTTLDAISQAISRDVGVKANAQI